MTIRLNDHRSDDRDALRTIEETAASLCKQGCLKRAGLSGWQLLSYISHFVDDLAPVERVLSGGRGIG